MNTPSESREVLLVVRVALLDRHLLGHAQRHAGGEDGDLVHRVGVLEHVGRHRVPGLVVRGVLLLEVVHHDRRPAQAHEHAVAGVVEVVAVDLVVAAAHREQRRLVHEVGEVGAGHARRAARDDVDVDVGRRSSCP